MDPLRKGIAIGMLFGSGKEAILGEKEVELDTNDITGSQTAIFEYDPADEDPQGDPPGPWDGYSLFTIDLSAVKDDIEDMLARIAALEDELQACHDCKDAVVAAMQVIDPNYVLPASGCPDDIPAKAYQKGEESVNLGSKFITQNGTYYASSDSLDGYDTVVVDVQTWESCIQQIAAKLGLTDPHDCTPIIEAIDEHEGYEFPPKPDGTPQDPDVIIPLIATDPLEDTSSRYVPTFYAALENSDTSEVTKSNAYAGAFRTAATGRWMGSLGIDIYDKTTKQTVFSSDSALSVGGYGLTSVDSGVGLDTMSIDPTTGIISVTFTWYHVWDTTVRDYVDYQYSKTVTNLTTYFTGYGTGTWKVRNT